MKTIFHGHLTNASDFQYEPALGHLGKCIVFNLVCRNQDDFMDDKTCLYSLRQFEKPNNYKFINYLDVTYIHTHINDDGFFFFLQKTCIRFLFFSYTFCPKKRLQLQFFKIHFSIYTVNSKINSHIFFAQLKYHIIWWFFVFWFFGGFFAENQLTFFRCVADASEKKYNNHKFPSSHNILSQNSSMYQTEENGSFRKIWKNRPYYIITAGIQTEGG